MTWCTSSRASPDRRIEPRHGFQVVVIDIGPGGHDRLHRNRHFASEIGSENFNRRVRRHITQCADDLDELACPAIGQIIAIDRSDDNVFQTHFRGRFGNMARFAAVHRARHAGLDVAERTGAGADIAQDHHGGVLFGPAFADIGARRFFADRVELQIAHQLPRFAIALAGRRFDPNPVRFALTHGRNLCVGRDRGTGERSRRIVHAFADRPLPQEIPPLPVTLAQRLAYRHGCMRCV